MKEFFEDRRMHGKINVACRYDDGSVRYWNARKEDVVQHIVDTVERYEALGYKLTLRQLHYQLVTQNWIINHDTAYKKLGTILDDCRYSGVIDWDAIEDRGRVPYIPYTVDSIEDALTDAYNTYRRNFQDGQTEQVELWTEKDALSGILKRSTTKYNVRLCVNKGYTSSSAIYEAYERILNNIAEGHHTTILYFGDHDPSGLDMIRDIRERLYFMLQNGREQVQWPEDELEIRAIGLTRQQVTQYNLPPNPTKMTDTRAEGYIAQFGRTCWEVDALEPTVLTQLVETNIQSVIDMDQYGKIVTEWRNERVKLGKFVKKMDQINAILDEDDDTDSDADEYNEGSEDDED